MAIVANPFLGVVFDTNVLVFFGMHEHLFAPLLVFEAKFVEATTALAAIGLNRRNRRLVRQRIRRFGFAIVNCAGDNWPIGISIKKFNDHFLANTRDEYGTPI